AGVALSLAVAAAVAVSYWRSDAFIIERRKVGPTFVQNWRFGQWVLAGRAVSLLNSDVLVIWLIAVLAGPAASGMFTACMGVVFFSNPFVLGVSNLLVPRIAQAHAQGGTTALHRAVAQTTWILGAPVAGFCLLLVVCADWALHALYGDAFAGQGPTVVALALGTLASVLGMGASNGLWVLGRPKANTLSSGVGLVITVATAGLLLPRWHTLGAAIGLLAGLGSESIVRNLFFRHYLRMARTAELIPVAAPYAESVAS
ncbi:MAG: lipopolysaccharide biosynthesis protein, partial [Vicinamibacterales bacterium]